MYSILKKLTVIIVLLLIIPVTSISQDIYSDYSVKVKKLLPFSTLIVHGKSLFFHPSEYDKNRTGIYTDLQFQVIESLYGNAEEKITIRLPAGTVEERTTFISDAPSFKLGEEAILFLKKIKPDDFEYYIVNFSKGKYNIYNSSSDSKKYVYCDAEHQFFSGYPASNYIFVDSDIGIELYLFKQIINSQVKN